MKLRLIVFSGILAIIAFFSIRTHLEKQKLSHIDCDLSIDEDVTLSRERIERLLGQAGSTRQNGNIINEHILSFGGDTVVFDFRFASSDIPLDRRPNSVLIRKPFGGSVHGIHLGDSASYIRAIAASKDLMFDPTNHEFKLNLTWRMRWQERNGEITLLQLESDCVGCYLK